jgi:hypothetical protein
MVLAATSGHPGKSLQDPLLALRGSDVAKAEGMGRREGWGRQAPAAAASRRRLIELAAITSRENGALAPEHVKNLTIAPSLAPVQPPPLALVPIQPDQPRDSKSAFRGGSPCWGAAVAPNRTPAGSKGAQVRNCR